MARFNMILIDVTREEFEQNRGKTFTTINTENAKSAVVSKYPQIRNSRGEEFHSVVLFQTYEEYLEYNKP